MFPGLERVPQPAPRTRSGKANASVLFKPIGSPARSGVKGVPSDNEKIPPSCHPLKAAPANPEKDFGAGTAQRKFTDIKRGTLKSDAALVSRELNISSVEIPLRNSSPAWLPEATSMLF